MAIKVALLKTGEYVIADMKEILSDDNIVAYLFNNPNLVEINTPILTEQDKKGAIQISLTKWILITQDSEIAVPYSHVVTIVEPLDSVTKMYLEKLDGQGIVSDKSTTFDKSD
tara:strand:- start:570 stop:908 length:339 start_codon:yes stop_codon:yes gene_type:complete